MKRRGSAEITSSNASNADRPLPYSGNRPEITAAENHPHRKSLLPSHHFPAVTAYLITYVHALGSVSGNIFAGRGVQV